MTIDEAIIILTEEVLLKPLPHEEAYNNALELGIEALKYIQYRDNCPGSNTRLLLPGETEK